MTRWRIVTLFGLCAGALIGVMAWLTVVVKRLEAEQQRSRDQATLEESVRLALWRLDSLLTPLVAQQNARPYRAYEASTPAPPAGEAPSHVRLYFEWDANGRLLSPGSPSAVKGAATQANAADPETDRRLARFKKTVARSTLLERVGSAWLRVEREPQPAAALNDEQKLAAIASAETQNKKIEQAEMAQQTSRNIREYRARSQAFMSNAMVIDKLRALPAMKPATKEVRTGILEPIWIGGELVLARRVRVGQEERLQGCWLDWPEMQTWLLSAISDILPEARLEPALVSTNDQGRRLAALPIRLAPGRPAIQPVPLPSALQLPLALAWVFAALALVAVGTLLLGLTALSERRAAFVSAVTHELRTPLTTFRMYADMLAEGMVPDEAQRGEYLRTLQREAERQSHLVENVLAYSRLERGRYSAPQTAIRLDELLDGIVSALETLAERYGMQLVVVRADGCAAVHVRADRAAVERILVNLVDNAGKYAHDAADRRITLECRADAASARMLVSDHGPGLARRERRRLFQPFHKSARDAAQSAPGVGLGLALSRRLARAMGGDLSVVESGPQGTCMSLRLPRVPPQTGTPWTGRTTDQGVPG